MSEKKDNTMKIKYFGTAAYEGIPALACQCETCRRALALGGKNLRTRAQALLNEEILFDFNPDTVAHYQTYRFDWRKIQYCLITHSHSDHFYPQDITMFAEPRYTHGVSPIDFYAGKSAYDKLKQVFSTREADPSRTHLTCVTPGELLRLGENRVLVLPADHGPQTTPVIYAVEDKDKKRILYAHDTGIFTDEVVNEMKRLGRFDIVSLDCTGSYAPTEWEHTHMSLRTNAMMKERLLREGLADDKTVFVVTHFSHNLLYGHDHEELSQEAAKYGFIVGYDGLEVEA